MYPRLVADLSLSPGTAAVAADSPGSYILPDPPGSYILPAASPAANSAVLVVLFAVAIPLVHLAGPLLANSAAAALFVAHLPVLLAVRRSVANSLANFAVRPLLVAAAAATASCPNRSLRGTATTATPSKVGTSWPAGRVAPNPALAVSRRSVEEPVPTGAKRVGVRRLIVPRPSLSQEAEARVPPLLLTAVGLGRRTVRNSLLPCSRREALFGPVHLTVAGLAVVGRLNLTPDAPGTAAIAGSGSIPAADNLVVVVGNSCICLGTESDHTVAG